MSGLKPREQAAIEAVAAHVSSKMEEGGKHWPDAYMTVGGKRMAIEVTTFGQPLAERGRLAKPRLRFDKVVLRTIGRLQTALEGSVPDGLAVIVTITAPIRLAARTATAVEERIRVCLARRAVQVEDTFYGNQIRICIVKGAPARASKVIGFVHNPGSDPNVLLHLTESLLRQIGKATSRPVPKEFTGDRWLVIVNENGLQDIETFRHVWSQLSTPTDYRKILMAFADGRVEPLAG